MKNATKKQETKLKHTTCDDLSIKRKGNTFIVCYGDKILKEFKRKELLEVYLKDSAYTDACERFTKGGQSKWKQIH